MVLRTANTMPDRPIQAIARMAGFRWPKWSAMKWFARAIIVLKWLPPEGREVAHARPRVNNSADNGGYRNGTLGGREDRRIHRHRASTDGGDDAGRYGSDDHSHRSDRTH